MEENTVNAALGGDSPVLDIDEFLGMPPLEENTVNVAQRGDGALQLQQGIPATGETGNDNLLLHQIVEIPLIGDQTENNMENLQEQAYQLIPTEDLDDRVYPASPKCLACDDEGGRGRGRGRCPPQCLFKDILTIQTAYQYKEAVKVYTKANLSDWLSKVPKDRGALFIEYRSEEALNIKGDLLRGSAKIIRRQRRRIHELEEQLKERDAIILNLQNGGSNPSVSVAPAAATSTLFQASGSVSTVSLTQNQSLQPVSQGYPNQPQQLSNPTVHQLSQQPQQQIPQNQIPYQYRTPNWSPYQPHFASNPIRYQSLQLQQPQRSPQLVFYQYPTTHQSQQLHQRPVSQEPVPILNPRYLNPTQHQYPQ